MSTCPYGIGFNHDGKTVALWCGRWSCDTCRAALAKRWAWRASIQVRSADASAYFWTLTLRPEIKTAYQGFRAIPVKWDNLRKTVQRKTGKWSYLAFVECHTRRSAIPHFHVLSLTPAPVVGRHLSTPIKDLAFGAGFGYMAKEEKIDSGKAASYVAKYASKHDPAIPRGFRRCRCSRDWAKLPEINLPAYLVKSRSEHLADFLVRVAEVTGAEIEILYTRWRVAHNLYNVGYYNDE